MNCRHCGRELINTFVDLGSAPPSNAYLTEEKLHAPEKWYPLKVMVCDGCWLVQTEDFVGEEEMFSEDYAYFSSYSSSWLEHAEKYVDMASERFRLNEASTVVEIAANDGYLLQYFKAKDVPCLGIEPTHGTAGAAREKGIEIIEEFFSTKLAEELAGEGHQADLMIANNVLAHVPDINDFVRGFSILLKPYGIATFEFPHLLNLVEQNQFDTIYHEHYSYLSLTAVKSIFEENGLMIFDVEELSTHGGSLRVYAQPCSTGEKTTASAVVSMLDRESKAGMQTLDFYQGFQKRTLKIKMDFVRFLLDAKAAGETVAAYGAAAKGNTLLNYSGVRGDLIDFVVDRNPAKQGKYMPGSHIPIVGEEHLQSNNPDYIIIFPWNIKNEIMKQVDSQYIGDTTFVTAIPVLAVQ